MDVYFSKESSSESSDEEEERPRVEREKNGETMEEEFLDEGLGERHIEMVRWVLFRTCCWFRMWRKKRSKRNRR